MGQIPKVSAKTKKIFELGKALTEKEAGTLLPQFESALKTIFKMWDKGITFTNKDRYEAYIWRSIDDTEIHDLAVHLVELGKVNRIVAHAVKRVTAAHRLLAIGAITGPRFILTVRFYQEHGFSFWPSVQKAVQHTTSGQVQQPQVVLQK